MTNTKQQLQAEDTSIRIKQGDEVITIDYADLEKSHQGDSWFGCTVGFRAMQAVTIALSENELWSRGNLYIVSGHPGPGVKDAIEIVTHCVSAKRFQLLDETNTEGCNRDMKFEWWLNNARVTVHVKLHDNIVSENFYETVDRLNKKTEKSGDRENFEQDKRSLSEILWSQSLDASFDVEVLSTPLCIGDLPNA